MVRVLLSAPLRETFIIIFLITSDGTIKFIHSTELFLSVIAYFIDIFALPRDVRASRVLKKHTIIRLILIEIDIIKIITAKYISEFLQNRAILSDKYLRLHREVYVSLFILFIQSFREYTSVYGIAPIQNISIEHLMKRLL